MSYFVLSDASTVLRLGSSAADLAWFRQWPCQYLQHGILYSSRLQGPYFHAFWFSCFWSMCLTFDMYAWLTSSQRSTLEHLSLLFSGCWIAPRISIKDHASRTPYRRYSFHVLAQGFWRRASGRLQEECNIICMNPRVSIRLCKIDKTYRMTLVWAALYEIKLYIDGNHT